MNRDPEPFLNGLDTGDGRQVRLGSSQCPYMLDDLGRQFVPCLGATVFWQQTAQASLLECRLSLINGGARNTELCSDIDDRDSVHGVLAEHLVADLKKIPGIEEWILFEQGIGDSIGVRVERTRLFQLERFLIGPFRFDHPAVRRK